VEDISRNLKSKYLKLQKYLLKLGSVTVAFSGGVDSTFLLKVAKDVLSDRVLAVTVHSENHSERDLKMALKLAEKLGVKHLIITLSLLKNRQFVNNTPQRCYYCKKQIFTEILEIAGENKFNAVIEASNKNDEKDFRPGLRALGELRILSPLRELSFSKDEIRNISKSLSLETYSHISSTCLATRVPYGIKLDKKILVQIDEAENYLFKLGFTNIRVRYHNKVARIETEPFELQKVIELRSKIAKFFKKLGFVYTAVDLEGYRSGSLNSLIDRN